MLSALLLTVAAQQPFDIEPVVEWIDKTAVPLKTVVAEKGLEDMQPVKKMVGAARIVSLGESTHGSREIFQMKHRMLEFLVKEMDFTVFGIEASYPDCLAINDYVLNGKGDLNAVVAGQGFWTWNTEEVMDMVDWMRKYNADPKTKKKVKFYGYDMQNERTALLKTLDYLRKTHSELVRRLEPDLQIVLAADGRQAYAKADKTTRSKVRKALEELKGTFDSGREKLIGASSRDAFEDAKQCTVVALQADEMAAMQADQPYPNFSLEQQAVLGRWAQVVPATKALVEKWEDKDQKSAAADFITRMEKFDYLWTEYFPKYDDAQRAKWKTAMDAFVAAGPQLTAGQTPEEASRTNATLKDAAVLYSLFEPFAPRRVFDVNWRDKCMADNIKWILDREGPGTKLMSWAHNGHAQFTKHQYKTMWSMGTHLEEVFGADHVVFGFSTYQGTLQAIYSPAPKDPAHAGLQGFYFRAARETWVDHTLAQAKSPNYILDLRAHGDNEQVKKWLNTPWMMRSVGAIYHPDNDDRWAAATKLADTFDAVIFLKETTRAIPSPLCRKQFNMPAELKIVNDKPSSG